MENTTVNGIPVEFGSTASGPIMEVHFMKTTRCSPKLTPWNERIRMYSNFSDNDFHNDNVLEFIEEKLPLHSKTKKVIVSYHQP